MSQRPKPVYIGPERDPITFKKFLLEYPLVEQPEKWRQQAERLFGETDDDQKLAKVQQFRDKLQESYPDLLENIPGNEDVFLLRILRASKNYDADSAAKMLDTYVQMIVKSPQFFDLAFDRLKEIDTVNTGIGTVLPHRDQFGRRILIGRGGNWCPSKTKFEDVFGALWTTLEMLAREERSQVAGLTVIVDGENFGWRQFRGITLEGLIFVINLLQETYPLWIRQINVVNSPWLFQKLYDWIRPWLNNEVKEMLHFHDSYESLHKNVDKSVLPQEYGGDLGSIDSGINAEASKQMQEMDDYFQALKKYVKR